MLAVAVALSVAGLLVGPFFVAWTSGTRTAIAALDGAILGIVPALVSLRLLPHLVLETGTWAIGAFASGYLVFWGVEARTHGRAKDIGLAIVVPTLAIHGFLDGTGLALAFESGDVLDVGGPAIGAALVVHKIPEGLFVASMLLPKLGARRTAVRIAGLGLATVLGAMSGRELLAHTSDRVLHVVVALGLGVLLRMAIHRHEVAPGTRTERLASGLAFVGFLAALLAFPDPQRLFTRSQAGELTALQTLAPLLLETAPCLLVVLLLGEARARWVPGRANSDGRSSMWLPALALSLPLLGPLLSTVRALLEVLCDGQLLHRDVRGWIARCAPRAREVLPSYIVGVGVAIALEAATPTGALDVAVLPALPAAALLGLAVRVGAPGATVIMTVLIHKGLPAPAAFVFAGVAALVSGLPKAVGSVRDACMTLVALLAAVLVVAMLGEAAPPPLHDLAHHAHPWTEWLCATVLALWSTALLAISGPRAWFGAVHGGRPREH